MRLGGIIVYGGVGLFLAGIVIGLVFGEDSVLAEEPVYFLCLPGLGAAVLGALFMYLHRLPCPRCRNELGYLFLQDSLLQVTKEWRFCPYCGLALDDPMPERTGPT
jgi:hypothetical protein